MLRVNIFERQIILNSLGAIEFKGVCHTLQKDNSLNSVERFDHMMFVCRFQASR